MTLATNLEPEDLVVAGDGRVAVSPEGTAFPTNIDDVINLNMAAAWEDLGYLTEAGPRFNFARTTKDIPGWQSFFPLRTIITDIPTQVEFDLRQWNSETFDVAMGGTIITTAGGGVKVEPQDPSYLDVRQLMIYGVDGDKHYAFFFRRAQNTKALQFPFARADESALPIGMKILGAGTNKVWFMLTDDPAFSEAS